VAAASYPPGLTDTDILIDSARGASDAIAFLLAQRIAGGIAISVISAMELVVGCQNAADLSKVRQFLSGVRILPVKSGFLVRPTPHGRLLSEPRTIDP
jgi:predicted nucleic acid-binding protein